MTLQQMEYIVALDKYRHFVLAAEACGITQPTLSTMIQKLEDELEVKIFVRDKKSVYPTGIGKKIIFQAQIAINEAQRIKEVVSDELDSMNGSLHIGVLPTIAPYIIPDFIYGFRKNYPNVELFIEEKESKSLVHDIRFGNLDMAFITSQSSADRLLEIPVYTEKFVAYFSEKCSKAQSVIRGGGLPGEHMWILKEGHCVPNGNISFCKNKEIGNHIYEAGSIDTLIRIVDKNGGYTIIPELHIQFLTEKQRENIIPLNINPIAQRQVSILIKEDYVRERMINSVREILLSVVPEEMVDERFKKYSIKLQ